MAIITTYPDDSATTDSDKFLTSDSSGATKLTTGATLKNYIGTNIPITTALVDMNGNELIRVTPTASAVNDITIANAATGNAPSITASGGDTNVGLNFGVQGSGLIGGIVENLKNPHAFRAYRNSAWNAATGVVKVALDSEDFDTGNNFDSSTNYRFVAPVSGFYSFSAAVTVSVGAGDIYGVELRKNGSAVAKGIAFVAYFSFSSTYVVSSELQLSASDYIELFFNNGSGSAKGGGTGSSSTFMSGRMISKA